jgi:hypothetical protein
MEYNDEAFKEIDDLLLDYRNSNVKLREKCLTYIKNVVEEKSTIRFDLYEREDSLPLAMNIEVAGLKFINGNVYLLNNCDEGDIRFTINNLNALTLVELCKEVNDVLRHNLESYLLNHNKEYLKDIKETDPEFVQDIIDAYNHYSNRLKDKAAFEAIKDFFFDGITTEKYRELRNAKELPSGIMLPFNANRNAIINHKFSWEQMTFYIIILEDRAYLPPFIKIVDYNKKDTNDVILKMENGELIAQ